MIKLLARVRALFAERVEPRCHYCIFSRADALADDGACACAALGAV